jgi:hypothetical protein
MEEIAFRTLILNIKYNLNLILELLFLKLENEITTEGALEKITTAVVILKFVINNYIKRHTLENHHRRCTRKNHHSCGDS